jgi:hypothetical protein
MIWFELSQILCSTMICVYIYNSIKNYFENEKILLSVKLKYALCCFGIPLIFPIVAIIFDLLGPSGRWCWISKIKDSKFYNIFGIIYYTFIWFLITMNIILSFLYRKKSLIIMNKDQNQKIDHFVKRLSAFPAILIICWLPATINRFIGLTTDETNKIAEALTVCLFQLSGVFYAIAFILTTDFKLIMKELIENIRCCKKNNEESTDFSNLLIISSKRFMEEKL